MIFGGLGCWTAGAVFVSWYNTGNCGFRGLLLFWWVCCVLMGFDCSAGFIVFCLFRGLLDFTCLGVC